MPSSSKFPKIIFTKELDIDAQGKIVHGGKGLARYARAFMSENAESVIGTNNANGTDVFTYTLPAYKTLAITHFSVASNAPVQVCIGTGALASVTSYFSIYLSAAGQIAEDRETIPFMCITNDTASSVTVRVYMPHSFAGAATNDAATTYVSATLSGILL